MSKLKSRLVGTGLGRALLNYSHGKSLRDLKAHNPESASSTANAVIADRLIANLTPQGGAFLDVGAHIGSILSSVRHAVPTATIYAVEADPDKAAALKPKYPYCTFFDVALGEGEGQIEFYRNPNATGFNSIAPSDKPGVEKIVVPVGRLDDLLPDETIDVIKMDIEGAELGALRGAEALIARSRPTVMFESVRPDTNALGYSPAMLWEWFDAHGYHVVVPDRVAHTAPPLTLEAFLDAHHYPFRSKDYFAIPSEKRDAVRERARAILGVQVRQTGR